MDVWKRAQEWETGWWADCTNTYGEEEKQLLYADRMGITFYHNRKSPYNINLEGRSVLDIGGGPTSMLLKCDNGGALDVVEPMTLPEWVLGRYNASGITVWQTSGEDFSPVAREWDEVWIYNVLQHTKNPRRVIKNAMKKAKLIRIFEWIDTKVNTGHLHTLTVPKLNDWLSGEGKAENLTGQAGCFGACYYGIFPTGLGE